MPADAPGRLDDRAAARPRRPGRCRSPAARASACSPRSRAQGGGVEADRISVAARGAVALLRADRRPAAAAQRLGRSRCSPTTATPPRSATSSSAPKRRRRCPNGSGSDSRCASSRSARWPGRSAPRSSARRSTRDTDAHARKAPLEARPGGEAMSRRSLAGWAFAGAGADHARPVLLRAGAARLRAQPDRFRPLRARRYSTTCASSASAIMPSCCRRRCSGRRSATPSTSSSSACRLSIALSLGAAMLLNGVASRARRLFPHRLVRAGRHHPGRGRGDLALSAAHPLRHDQLRARQISASTRSTGSAIPIGRCRRSSSSRCGRTSATTW